MNWWDRYALDDVAGDHHSNLKYLGNGLNGVVFRSRLHAKKKFVAIKFVRIPKKDKVTRNRFDAEISAMKKLSGECAVRI